MARMHVNEVETDASLVRRLLAAQFPEWSALPVAAVPSFGTDNALYRLGEDLVVRLPRIDWAVGQIAKEFQWLPKLAPHLPLTIPAPLEKGQPGEGYPWEWAVYRWLEGRNAAGYEIADPNQAAIDLATFVLALQAIDTTGGPDALALNLRGAPLLGRDTETRQAIESMGSMIAKEKALAVWETALEAPAWHQPPVWFHGDLLPGNLLFQDGRLSGVIDFSCLGVGDPACDLLAAWNLFSGESRETYRSVLGVDEATWVRGRGFALSQAVIFVPYYLDTNPAGVQTALHTIAEILADG